jgi:hypothetical protein
MTNLPPIIVIEFGHEELGNTRIMNMLSVFVDVLQRRIRSMHRTLVLFSFPQDLIFPTVSKTGIHDIRIVGTNFFENDHIINSGWSFVSLSDGAQLCVEAKEASAALQLNLAES